MSSFEMRDVKSCTEKMVDIAWDMFVFDDNADGLEEAIIREIRRHVVKTRESND